MLRGGSGLRRRGPRSLQPGERAELRWSDLSGVDLLLLGGAGKHTVTRDYDFTPYLSEALERWIESGRAFFGSCYGHHVMAKLFGAAVVEDPATEEVGTFEVKLTDAGLEDPVFSVLPAAFAAQLGHHDRVGPLPDRLLEARGFETMLQSGATGQRSTRVQHAVHPELSLERMRDRLLMYREGYVGSEANWEKLVESLRETPDAGRLLRRFAEIYVSSSFCASTANSIGSFCSTSRTKPFTSSATAASSSMPRWRA